MAVVCSLNKYKNAVHEVRHPVFQEPLSEGLRLSLEIEVRPFKNHLHFTIRGPWHQRDALQAIERVRELAQQHNATRLFADLRQVEGYRSDLDRFLIGQRIALVLPPPYALVVLEVPERINKSSENAAVNRGARLLVTDSETEGYRWLGIELTDKASA